MSSPPILAFEHVRCGKPQLPEGTVLDFRLGPGDCAWLPVSGPAPVTDLALGLLEAPEGRVLFEGVRWDQRRPVEAGRARGSIGCLFDRRAWLANLDLVDNVLLPARQHDRRPDAELLRAATRLAIRFGLSELPRLRVHAADVALLDRLQWVRALLGSPRLVLIERWSRPFEADLVQPLASALEEHREAGGAVLWIARPGCAPADLPARRIL